MLARRPWLFAAVAMLFYFAAPAAPAAPEKPPPEWMRPYGPVVPGVATDTEAVVAVRVLEWKSGRLASVRGARVACWSEDVAPTDLRSRKLAEALTDEHGVANVTGDLRDQHHWIVEAAGRAVWRDAGEPDVVVLEPGIPHRLRILGPMGRPLVGARVDYREGCSHGPDLRTVVTDNEGIAVIPDLRAEPEGLFRVRAPGVLPEMVYDPPRMVGDGGLRTILTKPCRSASGVVVGPDGRPRAGVVVREWRTDRGPATVTDAEGRFALDGIEPGALLGVWAPDLPFGKTPSCIVEDYVDDVPLRITLRDDRPVAPGEGEVRHAVRVDAGPLVFTRLSDGFTVRRPSGSPPVQLPPGTYRVVAGGGFSSVARVETRIEIPRSDWRRIRLASDRQPWLSMCDGWRMTCNAELRIPGARVDLPEHGGARLPSTGPAVLVFGTHVLPVGSTADGARAVELPEPRWNMLRLRIRAESPDESSWIVGWTGTPWEAEWEKDEDGVWLSMTRMAGRQELEISYDDHQTERLSVDLPATPKKGAWIDLGEVVLRRTVDRTFRVVDADGQPVADASPQRLEGFGVLVDEDGRFEVEAGPRPEPWIVEADGFYPMPTTLNATSPEAIRFPAGRLTLELRGPEGPLDGVVHVDEHRFAISNGALDLRGVPAGPHVLLIGAAGHLGEARRIVLRDGEARRLSILLPPR